MEAVEAVEAPHERPSLRGTAELWRALQLIVITDCDIAAPRSVTDVVGAALAGGARAVQVRLKDGSPRELLQRVLDVRSMCRAAGAQLFVNDRLDVAMAASADGVHLGPGDIPVAEARAVAPAGLLIGYSTDDAEEARQAVADGADYLGCGAVFATSSKADAGGVIGIARLDEVARAVPVPVVGIGGIGVGDVEAVARTAAAGIAVIREVMAAPDPRLAVAELLAPFRKRQWPLP